MSTPTQTTRVLMVIDGLGTGGAETSIADLAKGLPGNGIDVHIAYFHRRSGAREKLEALGVPLHHLGQPRRAQRLLALVRLIRRLRPGVVHTMVYEGDILGRVAATVTRVPVVSSLINTGYGREWFDSGPSKVKLAAAYGLDLVTGRLVTRYHAVSRTTGETMVRRLRLNPAKVVTIYRGRDSERYEPLPQPQRSRVRAELGLADDDRLIIATSRHEPQKRLPELVSAMPAVLAAHPRAHLFIAGRPGSDTAALESLIAEYDLADRVRLLGHRADVPELLGAADVFVSTSAWEGFAGSVVEALAVGVPVVATDNPSIREVTTRDDGFSYARFFPLGDRTELARAISETLSAGAAGPGSDDSRQFYLTRYASPSVAAQMADFYRSVATGKRPRKVGE